MAVETRTPKSVELVRQTLAYQKLTPKQKMLIETYIATGDKLQATKSAYQNESDEAARLNSYTHFANPRIVAVLNFWLGKTEREIMIEAVEEHLRHAEKGSTAARGLFAQLASLKFGIAAEPESKPEPEPKAEEQAKTPVAVDSRIKVGDIIRADGRRFRVTAVDEQGRATDGDPLDEN
jgi:hypothetical protein